MKRILSLDGGGIRGVFTIQVLRKVEEILRQRQGDPAYRMCDHYDLIAGTSTGAILATCLSWGMQVAEVEKLYDEEGPKLFRSSHMLDKLTSWFSDKPLQRMLKEIFSEEDPAAADKMIPSLLGTERLKTLVMLVTVRSDTLSPWPLTNNPNAMFNDRSLPDCNLNVPLWQLIRASTAAPPFFPAQRIRFPTGNDKGPKTTDVWFMDGAISGYNNPAALAFRTATLAPYRIEWETGPDALSILSIGTSDPVTKKKRMRNANKLKLQGWSNVRLAIDALTSISNFDQDTVCRTMAKTLYGAELDMEVGDLIEPGPEHPLFSYTRYEKVYSRQELAEAAKQGLSLAIHDTKAMAYLKEAGKRYARDFVRPEHVL